MLTIFAEIRESCERVAERARWVSVDEIEVNRYPEKLLLNEKIVLDHTSEHHLLKRGDDTLRFFIILDTINFGSGYFPFLDKDEGVSGYFSVARRLKDYCAEHGVPDSALLSEITKEECASIFQQDIKSLHMDELMELFSMCLRELGRWAIRRFDGDYIGFLKEARTADEAVRFLLEMYTFRDQFDYFGSRVRFLKRAQIMLQDIKLAEPLHPLIQFEDLDELTIFADNILPYVFNCDGVLNYDPWIENRIQNVELICSGSPEEIELRACSVYVAERIARIIREEFRPITVRELDYMLWNRGQKLKKQTDRKRHRTRCIYY